MNRLAMTSWVVAKELAMILMKGNKQTSAIRTSMAVLTKVKILPPTDSFLRELGFIL